MDAGISGLTGLSVLKAIAVFVLALLPRSPFQSFINAVDSIPYLAQLNWFFPVSECLVVMQAWLTCVAVYYLYQMIMRYANIIG